MASTAFREHLAELEAEFEKLEFENSGLRELLRNSCSQDCFHDDTTHAPIKVFLKEEYHGAVGTAIAETVVPSSPAILLTRANSSCSVTRATSSCSMRSPTQSQTASQVGSQVDETASARSEYDDELASLPVTTRLRKGRSSEYKRNQSFDVGPGRGSIFALANDALDLMKGGKGPIFADIDDMKERVRQQLMTKKYDVTEFYKEEGIAQSIARHPAFEIITLLIIGLNAIWLAIDTDYNDETILINASAPFQVGEHIFCAYFSSELAVRFTAFRCKRHCCRDAWFVFDSILVFFMIMETWVMSFFFVVTSSTSGTEDLGNTSLLRIARLLRLSRMARVARLLRAMPELMILIKGMVAASRSVMFTLLLLCVLLYVFAIGFTQLLEDTNVGNAYFPNVAKAMNTLWLNATLLDEISKLMDELGKESAFCVILLNIFILAASLTVMNMLIGVLCEVVSAVAASEKEELSLSLVKSKVECIFYELGLDDDHNGRISKEEFAGIIQNREAARAISDLGVDVCQLVDMADVLFATGDEDDHFDKELTFGEFMDMVVQLRGSNTATVKDILNLQKFISKELLQGHRRIMDSVNMPHRMTGNSTMSRNASIAMGERPSVGIRDTFSDGNIAGAGLCVPGSIVYQSEMPPREVSPRNTNAQLQ